MSVADSSSWPSPTLTASTETRERVTRLAINGELDYATAPTLSNLLTVAEERSGEAVILDLRDVTFLDCAALHVIQEAHQRAQRNGHILVLIGGRPTVRRVFVLTGLDHLFTDHDAAGVLQAFAASEAGAGPNQVPRSMHEVIADA